MIYWTAIISTDMISLLNIYLQFTQLGKLSVKKQYILHCFVLLVWWCLTPLSTLFQWQSDLLVEETGGPGENYWPVTSHWQTLSHNRSRFELTTSVVIGTDCMVVVNPTTIRSWRPLLHCSIKQKYCST